MESKTRSSSAALQAACTVFSVRSELNEILVSCIRSFMIFSGSQDIFGVVSETVVSIAGEVVILPCRVNVVGKYQVSEARCHRIDVQGWSEACESQG